MTDTEYTLCRTAFIVHTFDTGGIERCVAHLCNHLDRDRFRPLVICLGRSGTAAEWLERDDVEIVAIRKKPSNDLGAVRRLAAVLRERKIDVVHSHNWGTLVETSLARRWAGVPVHVHSERGTVLGDVEFGGIRHRLRAVAMRWALNRADAVISNAASVARRVDERCGFPAERIHLIPNGVLVPRIDDREQARCRVREELNIPANAFVVGSIGRLVPVKNFGMAIKAVARLNANNRNTHLILVGDGPERDNLTMCARSEGIADRVHLLGHREDIGNWLAVMDIYVNSSRSEGMSQSILEAMAAGLSQVVTDVGDNAELVGGESPCGRVVPAGDVSEMAAAMVDILEDPIQRESLGGNALARHQSRYEFFRMIRNYESFYDEFRNGLVNDVVPAIETVSVYTTDPGISVRQ